MKSITEFPNSTLQKVLAAKAAIATEGKTPEEITAAMGESLKLEGDKLKFALAAAVPTDEPLHRDSCPAQQSRVDCAL